MGLNATLREGDRGPAVTRLQQQLIAAGGDIGPAGADGILGSATEAALRAWQQAHDLIADGICGPRTWSGLSGQPLPATLGQTDLVDASEKLGVDLAAVMAVTEVESAGRGFIGRLPKVRFERHVMYRRLEHNGLDAAGLAARYPRLVNTTPGGYSRATGENVRLDAARRIDDTSGAESASYGLFQIMGYHATRIGYDSVQRYATAMARSEAQQLDAFVAFIAADDDLHTALHEHDWSKFAHSYNGPNYARNDYDHRLAAAWRRHARHLQELANAA